MDKTARDEPYRLNRRALLLFIGWVFPSVSAAPSVTIIFANESWYRERPEREQERTGILRRIPPPEGPNSRTALRYTFETGSDSLAIYAPGMTEKLDRLTGTRVTTRGKLVDLRSDGFGLEFWIASIRK